MKVQCDPCDCTEQSLRQQTWASLDGDAERPQLFHSVWRIRIPYPIGCRQNIKLFYTLPRPRFAEGRSDTLV